MQVKIGRNPEEVHSSANVTDIHEALNFASVSCLLPSVIRTYAGMLGTHRMVQVLILAINGADDVIVPQHDTLLFADRPGCTAHLIPDAGHCASGKRPEANKMIIEWLAERLDELT